MLFLVQDLLDFQQIKNEKFRKNERELNIRDSIQSALDIVKLAIFEKGLSLELQVDAEVPELLIVDS